MELDHVFILCAADAPEAEALTQLGLKEGPPNTHPGQGTACRRFLFHDVYLELLWVRDEREARSENAQRTRLWERWSRRGQAACPFGFVLRPNSDAAIEEPPFPNWTYTPSYLPQGVAIGVAVDTPLDEPEFFYLGFQRARTRRVLEPVAHAIPATILTRVSMGTPVSGQPSLAARSAQAEGILSYNASDEYVLELTFDDARTARTADLRPGLPLVLHW